MLDIGLCALSLGVSSSERGRSHSTLSPRVTPAAPAFCLSHHIAHSSPRCEGGGYSGPGAGRWADGDHLARLPGTLGLTLKARTGSLVLPGFDSICSSQPPGCAGRTRLSSPCQCLGCCDPGRAQRLTTTGRFLVISVKGRSSSEAAPSALGRALAGCWIGHFKFSMQLFFIFSRSCFYFFFFLSI